MTNESQCPDASQLQALLNAALSEEEQESLADHLTVCQSCRQRFDEMSECLDVLAQATRQKIRRRDQPDEALRDMMNKLRAERPDDAGPGQETGDLTRGPSITTFDLSLDFLSPPENPAHLGRLGPYEITEVVGRGGMGVVLKGFDPSLTRHVAIKVLSPQLASNGAARRRFLREARAAAAVSHDHVVTIHAVDETAHLPYLVMEYVAGRSLENRIKQTGPLKLEEILRIGMQAAAGLAAAHAQGLVHRDIKPSNILLENGVERVKLTDFGLAKAADDARITQTGVVTGTPEYMSPEQARGEPVDQRSDLFSLGCVLYAMCTGRSPFRASTVVDAIRRVCDDTPRAISEINRDIPNWLAAIIDRLLAKDPDDRFQTVSEVSELLGGHLAHLQQPTVVPRPPSVKSVSRKPAPAARSSRRLVPWLIAAACVVLIGVLVQGMNKGVVGVRTSDSVVGPAIVDPPVPPNAALILEGGGTHGGMFDLTLTGNNERVFRNMGRPETLRLPPGEYAVKFTYRKQGNVVRTGTIRLAAGVTQRINCGWYEWGMGPSPPERPCLAELLGHEGPVEEIAFSHDGKLIAAACGDGAVYLWGGEGTEWKRVGMLSGNGGAAQAVAFSLDDKTLATTDGDRVLLWDWARSSITTSLEGHHAPVKSLSFSPDGARLASIDESNEVNIWDLNTRTSVGRFEAFEEGSGFGTKNNSRVVFSPNGKILATAAAEPTVQLWDAETRQLLRELHGGSRFNSGLAFSPDGSTIAAADAGGTKLWDTAAGELLGTFPCDGAFTMAMAFSPDGKTIACGKSQCVRLFDVATRSILDAFPTHWNISRSITFCPTNPGLLATAGSDHAIRLWDVSNTPPPIMKPRPQLVSAFLTWEQPFGIGGGRLASAERRTERCLLIRNLEDLQIVDKVTIPNDEHSWLKGVCCLPDGQRFVSVGQNGQIVLWGLNKNGNRLERRARQEVASNSSQLAVSPDGHWIAATDQECVHLYESDRLTPAGTVDLAGANAMALAFCPERPILAVGADDGRIMLWDIETKKPIATFFHGVAKVLGLAFSPNGKTLATTTSDELGVNLWNVTDVADIKQVERLEGHTGAVFSAEFSSDGRWLVTGGGTYNFAKDDSYWYSKEPGQVKIWDLANGRCVADIEAGPCAFDARFTPDGKRIVVAADCKLSLWDIQEVLETASSQGE